MKKNPRYPYFLFVFFLIINNNLLFSQAECQVTYLASEGFVIESGDKKIMIDALPSKEFLTRQGVELSVINNIENAENPFNNVDLIFVTHRHHDHFEPGLTIKYMEVNKGATLVCPKQAFDLLKQQNGFFGIKERVFVINQIEREAASFELKGIPFKALTLPHGPYFITDTLTGERINKHADIINIGYLIDLDGIKVLHTGDNNLLTQVEFEHYELHKESVDIAFVEALFWGQKDFPARQHIVGELIAPKNIVLMHLNLGDDLSWVPKEMKNAYPDLVHFTNPLERRQFSINK